MTKKEVLACELAELKAQRLRWAERIVMGYRMPAPYSADYCGYCLYQFTRTEEHHALDCIVSEARAVLSEQEKASGNDATETGAVLEVVGNDCI